LRTLDDKEGKCLTQQYRIKDVFQPTHQKKVLREHHFRHATPFEWFIGSFV
jgi:hypothetical protein